MPYVVTCPQPECGSVLSTSVDIRGRKVTCPSCRQVFDVPSDLEDQPDPPADDSGPARKEPRSSGRRPTRPGTAGRKPRSSERTRPRRSKSSDSRREPARGRRPSRPASSRRDDDWDDDLAQEYDEESLDEYADDFGDDFGDDLDLIAPRRQSGKKSGSGGNWPIVRNGTLVGGIAACVLVLAMLFGGLSQLAIHFAGLLAFTAQPDREAFQQMSPEERRETMESAMSRMGTARDLIETSQTLFKIHLIVMQVATGVLLVAYIFWLFAPPSQGTRTIAIALLVLGIANVTLRVIFKLMPTFEVTGTPYDFALATASAGRTGGKFVGLSMLFDLLFLVELILVPLFLRAAALSRKSRLVKLATSSTYILGGCGIGMLVVFLLLFFTKGTTSNFILVFCWFLYWVVTGALVVGIVFTVRTLFGTFKSL